MEHIPNYIARKHGKEAVQFPHPDLKPILDAYGVIVYQEQIMQIASTMSGFSLGGIDYEEPSARKRKMCLIRNGRHSVSGALSNGYDEQIANETYDLIVRFANYGFNRSHAVAYSFIAWQLAWLKANFPDYFMAALLTSVIGNADKIQITLLKQGKSNSIFSHLLLITVIIRLLLKRPELDFSLAAIKGIGATVLKELIHARKGAYQDLFIFACEYP